MNDHERTLWHAQRVERTLGMDSLCPVIAHDYVRLSLDSDMVDDAERLLAEGGDNNVGRAVHLIVRVRSVHKPHDCKLAHRALAILQANQPTNDRSEEPTT